MTKSNTKIGNLRDAFGVCQRSFAAVGVFSLFFYLLMLAPMFYTINVYDKAVATGGMPTLMSLGIIAPFLCLMVASLRWVRSVVMIHVASRLDYLRAPKMYERSFKNEAGSLGAARKTVRAGIARMTDVLLTLVQSTRSACDLNEATFLRALSWVELEIVTGGDPQMLANQMSTALPRSR